MGQGCKVCLQALHSTSDTHTDSFHLVNLVINTTVTMPAYPAFICCGLCRVWSQFCQNCAGGIQDCDFNGFHKFWCLQRYQFEAVKDSPPRPSQICMVFSSSKRKAESIPMFETVYNWAPYSLSIGCYLQHCVDGVLLSGDQRSPKLLST